jgi:hypothetical protein
MSASHVDHASLRAQSPECVADRGDSIAQRRQIPPYHPQVPQHSFLGGSYSKSSSFVRFERAERIECANAVEADHSEMQGASDNTEDDFAQIAYEALRKQGGFCSPSVWRGGQQSVETWRDCL